ncbi:hypothetical protein [Aureispira sp. CCB-QB1]|uniref:hypothetical protein n=1 Tax=Aureispira sp. CCB-QB1 TaxID=1313421 RepID=UPI000698874A|nr:hypothetical protein [Aureispira sp. CCB-QB1]
MNHRKFNALRNNLSNAIILLEELVKDGVVNIVDYVELKSAIEHDYKLILKERPNNESEFKAFAHKMWMGDRALALDPSTINKEVLVGMYIFHSFASVAVWFSLWEMDAKQLGILIEGQIHSMDEFSKAYSKNTLKTDENGSK